MRIKPNSSGSSQSKQGAVLQALNARTRNRLKQHGFTLLEVMVVMVIMAIVAAIGIPAFADWREKQAVRSATQTLMAQLKQARVLAASENRSVSFTFTANAYVFDADTTPAGTCTTCKKELNALSQYSNKLSISPTTTHTFSSRGTVNAGSITLTTGSHSNTIKLNIIGRAYLQ